MEFLREYNSQKEFVQGVDKLDNEKFQEFIADQFTKLFGEFQGLKTDVGELKTDVAGLKSDVSELKTDVAGLKSDVRTLKSDVAIIKIELGELKESQVRLECEFHNQITALHDFRISQEKANQETKNELITLGTKLGELQMETAHLRVVK